MLGGAGCWVAWGAACECPAGCRVVRQLRLSPALVTPPSRAPTRPRRASPTLPPQVRNLQRMQARTEVTTDRALIGAFKEIGKICSAMKLLDTVRKQAEEYYKQVGWAVGGRRVVSCVDVRCVMAWLLAGGGASATSRGGGGGA